MTTSTTEIITAWSTGIQAFSTVVLVFITGYYAIQAKRTVDAMTRSSKLEFLPIVTLTYYPAQSNGQQIKISLKNEGRGFAKRPVQVTCPGRAPIYVNSMAPKEKQEVIINYDMAYILSIPAHDRVLIIEYSDIFGRTIKTRAFLIETNTLGAGANESGLHWETWDCILPTD